MAKHRLHILPVNRDNYSYIITAGEMALVVDPGDAGAVKEFLQKEGVGLTAVLLTHKHLDHTGGLTELMREYPSLKVISYQSNSPFFWQELIIEIIPTPGHTLNDCCYYIDSLGVVFTGDTLFTGGCGRMFEGDASMFHTSLNRLRELPSSVRVLSGHEYLEYSITFNRTLGMDTFWYESLRSTKYPSLETTIGDEKRHNPFFLTEDRDFAHSLGVDLTGAEFFAYLRGRKDEM